MFAILFVACGGEPAVESATQAPPVSVPSQVVQAVQSTSIIPDGTTELRPAPTNCPQGMLAVPGGRFVMGQATGDAGTDERFTHLVMVDGFCMDRTEVRKPGTNQPLCFSAIPAFADFLHFPEYEPSVHDLSPTA